MQNNMIDRAIETRSLERRFGDITAVRRVDLAVATGEFVALLGPSGSGKSTLLGLLAGFDRPDGGTVRLLDLDLADLSEDGAALFRRRHIGCVFQAFHLIPYHKRRVDTANDGAANYKIILTIRSF